MDRIIQPYGGGPFGVPPARVAGIPHPHLAGPAAGLPPKSSTDYLKALRRRAWLVLLVALVVIVPGAVVVLRQPNVYRAFAQIRIDPPAFDHRLATIVPNGSIGQESPARVERYVPDKIAELHSPGLAETVAADPELDLAPEMMAVAIGELASLQSRRIQDSNTYDLFLESQDPARAATLLNALLGRFRSTAFIEANKNIENSQKYALDSMTRLRDELGTIDAQLQRIREDFAMFTADDGNLYQEEYLQLKSILLGKRMRHEELLQQQRLSQFLVNREDSKLLAAHPYQRKIDELTQMKTRLQEQLASYRRSIARYDSDPAVRHYSRQLQQITRELQQLYRIPAAEPEADLSATIISYTSEEIAQLEREVKALLDQMQDSMPTYRNYQSLIRRREGKQKEIDDFQQKLNTFDLLTRTQNEPVTIRVAAEEPVAPIRPNRKLNLALVIVAGFGLGVGLVCLLESLDRRVKAPEHLTAGLTLPLYGVVPRMRRLAALHRGGHIWTAGLPNSTEADAYRNLRASLLGAVGRSGKPIITLLVTSAKPGEGKSTTALNLAATCARAGERTLLLDVDLRRSSLGEVFEVEHDLGLVDVLRGDLPWQRAVVRTDIPNLDFLPTGDPTGIPIEILGTIELRQLLEALSGHYHRVILDGPAVLGLADCRMLGRAADAALLVVRSGTHALDPPRRAKAMLEQSRVTIAGVVFNALDDDLENWSSYAPGLSFADLDPPGSARSRGLDAPDVDPAAVPAGSFGA